MAAPSRISTSARRSVDLRMSGAAGVFASRVAAIRADRVGESRTRGQGPVSAKRDIALP